MEHLESQLPALDVRLSGDVLDQIDDIVEPGTDLNHTDVGWVPAAIAEKSLRRRPSGTTVAPEGLLDAARRADVGPDSEG